MSPASARSSRPSRKTLTASASDASAAGTLMVGRAIKFHRWSIARADWPRAASQLAKVTASRSGSSTWSRLRASTGLRRRSRSAVERCRYFAREPARCSGAGSAVRRIVERVPSGARTGTSKRRCSRTSSDAPKRSRSWRYAVQQRRKTCCPLSNQRPLRSIELVSPPNVPRRSKSTTSLPASAADNAAAIPASPPPTTPMRAALMGERRSDSSPRPQPFPTWAQRSSRG